jgi:hypothetical protein
MDSHNTSAPIRVGVFDTVAGADWAVNKLLTAEFRKEELAVICSDKFKEHFFQEVPTPETSGSHTIRGTVAGGIVGAAIGGLALAATGLGSGGGTILVAGLALIAGGAFAGSFTGAMVARGLERDLADYYDQAVQQGKILVAVEVHGENNRRRLAEAQHIMAEAGVKPVEVPAG